MRLVGWKTDFALPPARSQLLDFSGISVCSQEIFSYMDSRPAFSIIEPFLLASKATNRVIGCPIDPDTWTDIGTAETLLLLQEKLGL
jgi:NDP-sugar pyrophosphorylase family protein